MAGELGEEGQDYLASFVEPGFLGRKLALGVDLYHRDLSFQSVGSLYDELRTGAKFSLTRALGKENLIGSVSYTIEDVGIIFNNSSIPSQIVLPPSTGTPKYPVPFYLIGNTPDDLL